MSENDKDDRKIYNWHVQSAEIEPNQSGCSPTLAAFMGEGGNDDHSPLIISEKEKDEVYRIRRLLPEECERLMGFPENHTVPCFKKEDLTEELVTRFAEIRLNWKVFLRNLGKPEEQKEDPPPPPTEEDLQKTRAWLEKISDPATCSDEPRYKVCGNSMGVNCMRWIGKRIQLFEEGKLEG